MNFYIGKFFENFNPSDENVSFSDELMKYLYNHKETVIFDMSRLLSIDPYDDIIINRDGIVDIVQICGYILNSTILDKYEDREEAYTCIGELEKICLSAIEKKMHLLSYGD